MTEKPAVKELREPVSLGQMAQLFEQLGARSAAQERREWWKRTFLDLAADTLIASAFAALVYLIWSM